jgi:predicted acetyltransferase
MPNTAIRRLEGDEQLEAMYSLTSYALDPSPPLTNKEEWKEIVRPRQGVTYIALYEDGAPASGAAGTAMIQNVRGKLFDAHGIWGVATAPAARRNGYCRRVIAALLAAGRDDGQALSTLYPFRESFYERLGYVTFPLTRSAKFAPSGVAPLLGRDLGGRVEHLLIGDGYDAYRDYLARMRTRTHGMGFFVHGDKVGAQRNRFWVALAMVGSPAGRLPDARTLSAGRPPEALSAAADMVGGGEPAGIMLYDLKGGEETKYLFRAMRFYYETSQARYLLLQWIARHIDQADRVELWLAPSEQPETWLADMQMKTESAIRAPMGRVLDVARIDGMTTGPGRFSARITDPLCPWNEGVWQFETTDGALRVAQGERPDCDLAIQGLTALVYGTHEPDSFAIRGWGNPSPAVQATMQAMFPRLVPHLHERF